MTARQFILPLAHELVVDLRGITERETKAEAIVRANYAEQTLRRAA